MISNILLISLLLLVSCRQSYSTLTEDKNTLNSPKTGGVGEVVNEWSEFSIHSQVSSNDIGGFDLVIDKFGVIHFAALIKVTDVSLGGIRYQLIYANNQGDGQFKIQIIKSDIDRFYQYRPYGNMKNFLSLAIDSDGNPILGYIDLYTDALIIVDKSSGQFKSHNVYQNVSSFDFSYNIKRKTLSIGVIAIYSGSYNKNVKFIRWRPSKMVILDISKDYGYGSSRNPIHVKVRNGETYIFYKINNYFERTGQFYLKIIADGILKRTINLGNGVAENSEFGIMEGKDSFSSCKKNILGVKYVVSIDFLSNLVTTNNINSSNHSSDDNCWLDDNLGLIYMGGGYNESFFSYKQGDSSYDRSQSFNVRGIFKIKLVNNKLFVIGVGGDKTIKIYKKE